MIAQKDSQRTGILESRYGKPGRIIIGIDEVGRGALAGPLTVAGVALYDSILMKLVFDSPITSWMGPLTDSKKLSPSMRSQLSKIILEEAQAWRIVDIPPDEIDQYGINEGFYKAGKTIVNDVIEQLGDEYADILILTDGNAPIYSGRPSVQSTALPKADGLSWSVAAASVIAKVARDTMMSEIEPDDYNFASHKGYGTKEHFRQLEAHGLSPIHRRTFCRRVSRLAHDC